MARKRKGLKAQMRDWNHACREMKRAATPPQWYISMGRRFGVTAVFLEGQEDAANAWLAKHPGHAVITVKDGRILMALKDDEGTPVTTAPRQLKGQ